MIAQILGAILGAALLYVIASGQPGFKASDGFAANGYGEHSPGGYSLLSGAIGEVVLTFIFLIIIMGSTARQAPQGFAPLAIGLGLALIHFAGIPLTGLSVNPARSLGPAIFAGGWAISQLWLFWVAPIAGGILGGVLYSILGSHVEESPQSPLEKLAQQSEARAESAERMVPPAR